VPTYPLRALVLRKTKLGEADTIVTLLAEDGRQVRAVAKGVRRTKSKIGSRVEPYAVVDLLLATGRNLEVVQEVETVAPHEAIRSDYDRAAAAAVVADLLDKVSVEGQVEPKTFPLALTTLDVMETAQPADLRALVLAFLVKALAMQGYRPTLDTCARCACEATDATMFSVESGGVLCDACGRVADGAMPLTCDARLAMGTLLNARMADVASLQMPRPVADELLRVLGAFAGYHIPSRLKALEYFARHG
jgi:DNA repair protein RecO (recombination protein O)